MFMKIAPFIRKRVEHQAEGSDRQAGALTFEVVNHIVHWELV